MSTRTGRRCAGNLREIAISAKFRVGVLPSQEDLQIAKTVQELAGV